MNLLAPAMLLGLLGLGVPIAAHLLGRREPRVISFAGQRFLQDAEPHIDRRPRLRDILLLAVRLGILALIVTALAQPVSLEDRDLPVFGAPHDALLLVDSSASMMLLDDEGYAVERAIERAEEIVEALPPGSRLAWMVSDPDGPSHPLAPPTTDDLTSLENFLREDLRPGSWALRDAIEGAMSMFDDDERPRVIYAIGDPTPDGLASLPLELGGDLRLIAVPVRDAEAAAEVDQIGIHAMTWDEPSGSARKSGDRVTLAS
jgi:hypothetical protein